MNDLSCSREKPCEPQLNDGERLYTSHLPNETSNNELRVSAPAATVARARVETRVERTRKEQTCLGSCHGSCARTTALV